MFGIYEEALEWVEDLASTIESDNAKVVQYPYRKASIKHYLAELEREDPAAQRLEGYLARKAGSDMDNFSTYAILFPDGEKFAVYCCDDHMILGLGVQIY